MCSMLAHLLPTVLVLWTLWGGPSYGSLGFFRAKKVTFLLKLLYESFRSHCSLCELGMNFRPRLSTHLCVCEGF